MRLGVVMKYKSVLIIDDEVDIADTVSEVLSDLFENISKAKDGEEAYNLVIKQNFDLIISDIMMPKLKGDEFLTKIRMKGVHTPIIFITGNGNKENLMSALRLGAVDYIEKPFDLDKFTDLVSRTMEYVSEKNELENLKSKETPNSDKFIIENQKKTVGILQVAKYLKSKIG